MEREGEINFFGHPSQAKIGLKIVFKYSNFHLIFKWTIEYPKPKIGLIKVFSQNEHTSAQ